MRSSDNRCAATSLCTAFAALCFVSTVAADETNVLVVLESSLAVHMVVDLPTDVSHDKTRVQLVEVDDDSAIVPVQFIPRVAEDGTVAEDGQCLAATIAPTGRANGKRRFKLQPASGGEPATSPFKFATIDDKSLKITESDKPVLTYNYGMIIGANVPETDSRRKRACYIHPLWQRF